jgi:hypothetical protein
VYSRAFLIYINADITTSFPVHQLKNVYASARPPLGFFQRGTARKFAYKLGLSRLRIFLWIARELWVFILKPMEK